jgi:predicted small lipoprotein YifL
MNMILRVLAASIVAILVSSCGQSGQLFIPGDPSEIQAPPVEEPSVDSETDEETEQESATE